MAEPASSASNIVHLTPPIVRRPALALWMWLRGLKTRDAEGPLGVKAEQVRRYCLPFADPARVTPPPAVMRRISEWTRGEAPPASFYDEGRSEEAAP